MTATNHDIIDSALCIWEYCLDYNPENCQTFRELHGVAETRDRVQSFAKPCHDTWEHAHAVLGFDAPFDWEWVPAWFNVCVDEDFDLVLLDVAAQTQLVMERINAKV